MRLLISIFPQNCALQDLYLSSMFSLLPQFYVAFSAMPMVFSMFYNTMLPCFTVFLVSQHQFMRPNVIKFSHFSAFIYPMKMNTIYATQ